MVGAVILLRILTNVYKEGKSYYMAKQQLFTSMPCKGRNVDILRHSYFRTRQRDILGVDSTGNALGVHCECTGNALNDCIVPILYPCYLRPFPE